MSDNEYSVAGWMAIAGAAMTLPTIGLGVVVDFVAHRAPAIAPTILVVYMAVAVLQMAFSLYAFYRLRDLLNSRHGFHDVDTLIIAIIVGAVLAMMVALPAKALATAGVLEPPLLFLPLAAMFAIALPLGIISVIFAIRLMRLESDLHGYLKPYAFLTIVAAICFATLILAPVGVIIDGVCTFLLGLIFLRPAAEEPTPEFV